MKQPASDKPVPLPTIRQPLMRGFERYFLPRYLQKHFHCVAVNRNYGSRIRMQDDVAVVVYANHPSWWDPLIAIYLRSRLFEPWRLYAPIDAAALQRYRIFSQMGFYGIEAGSRRGARDFLDISSRLLQTRGASIWLTPEGRFADPRDHSTSLMPGLSHLAASIQRGRRQTAAVASREVWFVPLALEISFWEERLPECLSWFGEPLVVRWHDPCPLEKQVWSQRLTEHLRTAQRELAAATIARDPSVFEVLLSGRAGTWSVYDAFRRTLSRLRGRALPLEHGNKLTGRSSHPSHEDD
jgi:1-acyl-sn-glycerol-3-phosphate acyltransferase